MNFIPWMPVVQSEGQHISTSLGSEPDLAPAELYTCALTFKASTAAQACKCWTPKKTFGEPGSPNEKDFRDPGCDRGGTIAERDAKGFESSRVSVQRRQTGVIQSDSALKWRVTYSESTPTSLWPVADLVPGQTSQSDTTARCETWNLCIAPKSDFAELRTATF